MAEKGVKFTEEHRKNIGKAYILTSARLQNARNQAKKGYGFKKGHGRLSKGSTGKHWKKTIEQLERSRLANLGSNNPNWKGGLSCLPYSVDWTLTLKKSIRERDHYICRVCLKNGFHIHHIDYNKKNSNPNNLITLCKSCHQKTNFNRNYWIKYFG